MNFKSNYMTLRKKGLKPAAAKLQAVELTDEARTARKEARELIKAIKAAGPFNGPICSALKIALNGFIGEWRTGKKEAAELLHEWRDAAGLDAFRTGVFDNGGRVK